MKSKTHNMKKAEESIEDKAIEWSGSPDPDFPDIQWIDDETGEIKKAE